MIIEVVPEAISSGSSCRISDEGVLGVGDPEGGRNLVSVEEGGGASREDAEVSDVAIVGLYSVLLLGERGVRGEGGE